MPEGPEIRRAADRLAEAVADALARRADAGSRDVAALMRDLPTPAGSA